jgi:hypothetical protein
MKNKKNEAAGFFEEVISVVIYGGIIFAAVFLMTR